MILTNYRRKPRGRRDQDFDKTGSNIGFKPTFFVLFWLLSGIFAIWVSVSVLNLLTGAPDYAGILERY